MIKFEHDYATIQESTARALLGKKEYIVDTAKKTLHDSDFMYTLTIYKEGKDSRVYITQSTLTEDKRFERAVELFIAGHKSRAQAYRAMYSREELKELNMSVFYKDWSLPNAKKLEEIITKTL